MTCRLNTTILPIETELKIGISTCLLGEPVRYDGSHKLDHFLVETLGRFVSFVPVCPETECGLGVPRETMLMEALRLKSSLAKNSNVLFHILGYSRNNLTADKRQEMVELIDRYRGELVPLIMPITHPDQPLCAQVQRTLFGRPDLSQPPPYGV